MNSALRNLRGARRFSTTVIRMGTDKEKGIWRQESTPRQGQMGARNLFRSSGPLSTIWRNEFRAPKKIWDAHGRSSAVDGKTCVEYSHPVFSMHGDNHNLNQPGRLQAAQEAKRARRQLFGCVAA